MSARSRKTTDAFYAYAIAIPAVLLTTALGSYFTNMSVQSPWYKCIQNTGLTPPPAVFPVVWTVLYVLIALALASSIKARQRALTLLISASLVLNVAWCYLFFTAKQIVASAVIIGLLVLLATGAIVLGFRKRMNVFAASLLVPYATWLCFATVLNISSASRVSVC